MQHVFVFFICYIGLVLLILLLYNSYLFAQKMKCAYIIELKNNNPNILIQTKVKVISKNKTRIGICHINNIPVEVILKDEKINSIKNVYYNKKANKYYSTKKSNKDIYFDVSINEEKTFFVYKLKNREIIFIKKSYFDILEKEFIVFKNPFTNHVLFENELDDKEITTEMELAQKIPKSLDKYFFGEKSMNYLYEIQNKNALDILKPTCIWIGIVFIIFFVLKFFI